MPLMSREHKSGLQRNSIMKHIEYKSMSTLSSQKQAKKMSVKTVCARLCSRSGSKYSQHVMMARGTGHYPPHSSCPSSRLREELSATSS